MRMKMMVAGLAIGAALVCHAAQADEDFQIKLNAGDKAPALDIAHWIKGDKFGGFEKGKFYVVEFWATWCGPCRMSMPHISEMQEKYKDYNVTFIGISDEELDKVKGFLDKPEWAEKTHYTLATDPDKSVYKDYMDAARQQGIPTAFVVGKDGTIQWIGHPMSLDQGGEKSPIEQIVHDRWDAKAFRASFEKELREEYESQKLQMAYIEAARKQDWPGAVKGLDAWIAAQPDNPFPQAMKFKVLLGQMHDSAAAYGMGRSIVAKFGENPMVMNDVAWYVVDDKAVTDRNLEFALEAATKAAAATNHADAAILDTLARVYWEKGDKAKAIEIQKEAVAKAPPGPMADDLKKSLETYQGG